MIAHLSGTLLEKNVQRLIVDVGGVGYAVIVPLPTFYAAGEPGGRVTLRIHTHVREEALQLFGFATALELSLFERLIEVNGIGPKLALAVLSGIEPADLIRAVESADVARLTKVPGLGKKKAEMLVLQLRDRLPQIAEPETSAGTTADGGLRDDLLSALGNLGYQRGAIEKTVDKVLRTLETRAFEDLLRAILRELVR